MFTGIVAAVGEIKQARALKNIPGNGLCLDISSDGLNLNDVAVGDSIAVNGVCLTVTAVKDNIFSAVVSQETLCCTYGLDQSGEYVNLEKAMRLSDRLGGHLVSGHVDNTGEVVSFKPVGESYFLSVRTPDSLLKYMTKKGSIAVNGVSLTINQVVGNEFSVNLIPHTLAVTTLSKLVPGTKVNLETDMLARYVANLINVSPESYK